LAWRRKGAWEPEIRLLDAVGQSFGVFSPRSLGELQEQALRLPQVGDQLDTHAKAWKAALGDANRANLDRFLSKQPAWAEPVSERALREGGASARELAGSFLYDLGEHTRGDSWMEGRLGTLHGKADMARTLAYRMEVRLGVVLRMRTILATIAGREYLSGRGTASERTAYQALVDCESLSLPLASPVPGMRPALRPAFPAFEDDLAAAREVLPAWLGIRFGEVSAPVRKARELTRGAASVTAVYPDSPASEADLQVGDVILGPPEAPFSDPRQIREWTMLASVDKPASLAVLRGDERLELVIVPKPYPMKWPELPGPPRVANAAPAGAPCSSRRTGACCRPTFEKPFPERVATDELRRSFLAYGVSGTPTFVLVDGEGVIRSYSVGYSPAKSLGIEGWTWSGTPVSTPPGAP
jgi:hypothetical protein